MLSYPARFTREGKAIVVAVPDIPEVITNGYSEAEAMEFAADAIEVVLAEYVRRGREIPRPSKPKPGHETHNAACAHPSQTFALHHPQGLGHHESRARPPPRLAQNTG